jgi:hypothetical protein
MSEMMGLGLLVTQNRTKQDVQLKGRSLQGVVSGWDQQLFPSSSRNRGQWHLVLLRKSTW